MMRRKEREVTDPAKIRKILSSCRCCRLGLCENGHVYIVPLNFGYIQEEGAYTLYFHSAKEGRKIRLLMKNPHVGFEMDTNHRLKESASACSYSAYFQSIIGEGTVTFIENISEKKAALQAIMQHNTGKPDWNFPDKAVETVCVFRLTFEKISCKENMC